MNLMDTEPEAERYGDLPRETREMLEGLRPDEIAFLRKLIRLTMSFGTAGRAIAYIGGAILGLVIGLPMLIDAIGRIVHWFPSKLP